MVVINDVTNFGTDSNIAILTLNSPPVNALSAQVREGLHEGIKKAIRKQAEKVDEIMKAEEILLKKKFELQCQLEETEKVKKEIQRWRR